MKCPECNVEIDLLSEEQKRERHVPYETGTDRRHTWTVCLKHQRDGLKTRVAETELELESMTDRCEVLIAQAIVATAKLTEAERKRDAAGRNCAEMRMALDSLTENGSERVNLAAEVIAANAHAERLQSAGEVLAEFVKTAPGRLPERVTMALAALAQSAPEAGKKEGGT
jgi:hypothetical protein